ncbi:trypsin-like peptidase domain-containing protein [Candidatus Nomurabacteria bacterium]|nr:trypsin-like peptidase domain-containing protein [Candidatus Nomurabacteria bacterium]
MSEKNIIKFIKKIFSNQNFLSVFLTSFISLIIFFIIASGLVWYYRANLFEYFAKEYLQEMQNANLTYKNSMGATEASFSGQLFTQESFVVDAVKKTSGAVVAITISKEVPKYETYIDPNQQKNPFGNLFPNFFFNTPQYRQNGTEKKEIGGGSGFFVSKDGLIVTNKHVVDKKDVEYTVLTNDGKKYEAKVVARDPILDVALIKIEGSDFPYLSLGDSNLLNVGQSVIAIGNALAEFNNTVSVGIVSGLSRSITAGDDLGNVEFLDQVIQTDAAINPGNSGGPLLDLYGRVIGVNVAVAQGSQNIGFALPINSIKSAIESVKTTGKIVRPYLGVRYTSINAEMKEKNGLEVDYGILVRSGENRNELAVIPGSPADKAGIVENDIILEIDDKKLDDKTNLASIIRQKNVGDVVKLKILHKGKEKTVEVVLEAAKDN